MSAELWADCYNALPKGWKLTSDVEKGGFRVRVYDPLGQCWVSRWKPTFEAAVAQVRDDIRTTPALLREWPA